MTGQFSIYPEPSHHPLGTESSAISNKPYRMVWSASNPARLLFGKPCCHFMQYCTIVHSPSIEFIYPLKRLMHWSKQVGKIHLTTCCLGMLSVCLQEDEWTLSQRSDYMTLVTGPNKSNRNSHDLLP